MEPPQIGISAAAENAGAEHTNPGTLTVCTDREGARASVTTPPAWSPRRYELKRSRADRLPRSRRQLRASSDCAAILFSACGGKW
jgi:hypothetical protein